MHSGIRMGKSSQDRAGTCPATETDGDAGTSPEDGEGSRPAEEEDNSTPGAGDGTGQQGTGGPEWAVRDNGLRVKRGWS